MGGIAPSRRANELDDAEAERLHAAIAHVIQTACDANANSDAFPGAWLFHRRWGKDAEATTEDGHALQFDTI